MGKTSQQWWNEVKSDPKRFNGWLIRQYRGEVTAAERILCFAALHAPDDTAIRILTTIANQETQHAEWVLTLLKARGIQPDLRDAEKRYWKETMPQIASFATGCAVGAHAEKMRLERIQTIAEDATAPWDVKEVFTRILKDELFHERAFRELAGPQALEETVVSHRKGREVLGLVP